MKGKEKTLNRARENIITYVGTRITVTAIFSAGKKMKTEGNRIMYLKC